MAARVVPPAVHAGRDQARGRTTANTTGLTVSATISSPCIRAANTNSGVTLRTVKSGAPPPGTPRRQSSKTPIASSSTAPAPRTCLRRKVGRPRSARSPDRNSATASTAAGAARTCSRTVAPHSPTRQAAASQGSDTRSRARRPRARVPATAANAGTSVMNEVDSSAKPGHSATTSVPTAARRRPRPGSAPSASNTPVSTSKQAASPSTASPAINTDWAANEAPTGQASTRSPARPIMFQLNIRTWPVRANSCAERPNAQVSLCGMPRLPLSAA
ncbi:MAG: hypothetical protein AUG49_01435 [Catenulispora sp. 13_1_20CM_3_70_7]|nr:MAG: hypothetical protein AUG49_01435 [Catenulispora sp. 13_1_20CM_3_70_7]